MMEKRALIFGIGGMDGSYLAEVLLENGYKVYGTTRKSSVDNLTRISHIKDKLSNVYRVELTDYLSIYKAIVSCDPHEIYNEADQDNVGWSNSIPGYSIDVTVKGALNILEASRYLAIDSKVFLPISATIYGDALAPQNESTPFNPLSPYACAKASVYYLARYYRQIYGLWVSTGILYNHDSPRRGKGYLLQDIYEQCLNVQTGLTNKVTVGSLSQIVDIGYAREFVEGIYRIMQCNVPTDMILSSGVSCKIIEIVNAFAEYLGIGVHIEEDSTRRNSTIETTLVGDINRAQSMIGWNPNYYALNMIEVLNEN
jgi:GDPmannose 4,6-dehydratase